MTGVFTVKVNELSINFLDIIKKMFNPNEEIEISVRQKSVTEKNGLDIAIEEIENGEVETFDSFEAFKVAMSWRTSLKLQKALSKIIEN